MLDAGYGFTPVALPAGDVASNGMDGILGLGLVAFRTAPVLVEFNS